MNCQRAVVLGGGLGGLAIAARLRAQGHATTIVERNAVLGGRAHTFEKSGFTYDAGPTVVTAPYLFGELFELFGERIEDHVEFLPVTPWYRYSFPDGDYFNYGSGDALYAEIERVAPGELDHYRQFSAYSAKLFERGYEQLGAAPFHRVGSMLRELPFIVKTRAYRSLYGMVSSYFKSEKLRQVFATPSLLVGGSPLETPAIYGLIHTLEQKWGVWYAKGGTGALVEALVSLLERHGVEFVMNASVDALELNRDRITAVRTDSGERIEGELFASNMDPAWAYDNLLPKTVGKLWRWRNKHARFSFGLFVLFFNTRCTYESVAHHTIVLQSDYEGSLEAITRGGQISDEPNIYLHRPAATQPIAGSRGESYYALVPVPNLKIDANTDWGQMGAQLEANTIRTLEQRFMPGLSSEIGDSFYTTPIHFRDRFHSSYGAGFSISPDLTQSAWFRYHNLCSSVKNLYFTGAGTHPGAGMPGVLNSAKIVGDLIAVRGT
ncbi:MAG TPA: phytoene desaturase [Opitutae bacterium]|nr:phytoene desaturase [Opitutae bacterium]